MKGQRLRELRKDAGLSQKLLGSMLNVSESTIGKFEMDINEPNDETKIALAKHFCVSVDYLLGLTDERNPDWNDRRYVRLPGKLPDKAKEELAQFIDYLLFKYLRQGSGK